MSDEQMPKRGRPTGAERAARRERILDAAVSAFAARGFGGTSLDDVAATAGVTKRTLYVDVGDKAALFTAAVEREHDRIRAVTLQSPHALLSASTEIVHVLHSDRAVALHRAVIADAPGFPELAERFYETGPGHSIAVLERALPDQPLAHDRATALYSLLLGERHRRRLLGLDPAPTRAQAAHHAAACLGLLGVPGNDRSPEPVARGF
jgi:AcrR family transcriptional regulator